MCIPAIVIANGHLDKLSSPMDPNRVLLRVPIITGIYDRVGPAVMYLEERGWEGRSCQRELQQDATEAANNNRNIYQGPTVMHQRGKKGQIVSLSLSERHSMCPWTPARRFGGAHNDGIYITVSPIVMYLKTFIYLCIYVCMHIHKCICIYIYIYIYTYIYTYTCMYIYIYIYVYIYIYLHIHTERDIYVYT